MVQRNSLKTIFVIQYQGLVVAMSSRNALFLVFISFLSSCSNDERYEDVAHKYLSFIEDHDWRSLYSCKNNSFKDLVSYDVFFESMVNSSKDFKLGDFSVREAKIKDKYVRVPYTFTLVDPETQTSLFTMQDEQVWEIFSDENLICRDLGMSSFFPFNSDVIAGNKP